MRSKAFTLIETLAAVALLGLAASVVALGLVGAGDRTRLREVVITVQDLDQRARELARSGGPVVLGLDGELHRMTITSLNRRGAILSERWLPSAVEVTFRDSSGGEIEFITFGCLGRSQDYTVRVAIQDRAFSLSVAGLTGWMEESP